MQQGSSADPIRGWLTMASTALDDLERAAEFGVNLVIIQDDIPTPMAWNRITDALALYDFSDRYRRKGEDRRRVEAVRERCRAITASARKRGVVSYVLCGEVHVPAGFDGLSYDNPEMWTVLYERQRETFRAVPELDGWMLYFAEGDIEAIHLPGSEKSMAARYRRLLDTIWAACRAEGRKLLLTTFIHAPERLEAIAEVLREFPPHPDFAVLQYCCPNDWGLYAIENPSLGQVGPHPEILAFDCAAENWGQGAHPFVHVDFMAERLRSARQKKANLAGLAGFVSWYGRRSLGTLNEANIFAAGALADDPDRDPADILHQWCAKRFGEEAADIAARCLGRTHEAIYKAQHVFGYWLDTGMKSCLPSVTELQRHLIEDFWGEALYAWDGRHRIGLVRQSSPEVDAQLKKALASLSREADELEAQFGADVFPRGPGRAREFARCLTGTNES